MRYFLTILFLGASQLWGTGSQALFSSFVSPVFVETGTWMGEGVEQALKAGYPKVLTIELHEGHFKRARRKFKHDRRVRVFLGDSSEHLYEMIKHETTRMTFWLDGHYSGVSTALGSKSSPILEELRQIAMHPIKTHTILIDDVRQMGTKEFDYVTLEQIKEAVLQINPNYKFSLHDGHQKNDILACHI